MAAVTTIAEWVACTEVAVAAAAAVAIWVSVVVTEAAGEAIASPPTTSYRITRGVKIARATNSPPLNRRPTLSKRKTNGKFLSPVRRVRESK